MGRMGEGIVYWALCPMSLMLDDISMKFQKADIGKANISNDTCRAAQEGRADRTDTIGEVFKGAGLPWPYPGCTPGESKKKEVLHREVPTQ